MPKKARNYRTAQEWQGDSSVLNITAFILYSKWGSLTGINSTGIHLIVYHEVIYDTVFIIDSFNILTDIKGRFRGHVNWNPRSAGGWGVRGEG